MKSLDVRWRIAMKCRFRYVDPMKSCSCLHRSVGLHLLCVGIAGVLFSSSSVAVETEENIDWQTVMRDRERQVQINRSTVTASTGSTRIAWARLLRPPSEAATKGYVSVRTLNRYDCKARTYTTIKREYLDAYLVIVRTDEPEESAPQPVRPSSVDERLWREVCGAPSAGRVQDLVRQADQAASSLKR